MWLESSKKEICSLHTIRIKNKWPKTKLYDPFFWMEFNCLKATATSRRQFTFYHSVPRTFWCSIYRPRKDERLSQPWSHPVVLNTEPLDWESSPLTNRPLLHNQYWTGVLQHVSYSVHYVYKHDSYVGINSANANFHARVSS